MLSTRELKVALAVASCLKDAEPFLLPEGVLRADAARSVVPRATETELTSAITWLDQRRRLTSTAGDTETKWKLNDVGRAWLLENQ